MSALIGRVRVRQDGEARAQADALGALAFTRGGEIYWGSAAPGLESEQGRELLSHEMVHVAQQREAGAVDDGRINQPGDAFEQAAQGGVGRPAGTPPGTQRQMADTNLVYRVQAEALIERFIEQNTGKQGGISEPVKTRLVRLAAWPNPRWKGTTPDPQIPLRSKSVEDLLNSSVKSARPADLAKQIARLLPNPMDPAAFVELGAPLRSGPSPSSAFPARVARAFEKTVPATPQFPDDPAARSATKAQTQYESAIGQHDLPIPAESQIIDMLREMGKSKSNRPPAGGRVAKPKAVSDAQPDLSVTPRMKQRAATGFNLSTVTAQLTQLLETIPKGQDSADLRLPAQYIAENQLAPFLEALEAAIETIRGSKRGLAERVGSINIYFGDRIVGTIRTGR